MKSESEEERTELAKNGKEPFGMENKSSAQCPGS